MYSVDVIRVEQNGETILVIPTEHGFGNETYCYVFSDNPYNWDIVYTYGKYIDDSALFNGDEIVDVYTLNQDIESLMPLDFWSEIECYFHEI